MKEFKESGFWSRLIVNTCVITTGITLLEGILGSLFLPQMALSFHAYLVPPIFGVLTALTGLVVESRRSLSVRQMLFRMLFQLLLIECMVFGVNYVAGNVYSLKMSAALALGILAVFVFVYFVMWLNERRIAMEFNRRLAQMQKIHAEGETAP